MRTGTMLAMAAAIMVTTVTATWGQAPKPVPPKDPATPAPMPTYSLESLWQEIDCDCECDCCDRIKGLIKKRLKDPKGRPMLAPGSDQVKPRRQRDMEKREARIRHPRGTASMWDRPWPRSGDRWLDAARAHKFRKAHKSRKTRDTKRSLDLSDEQRRSIDEVRYQSRLQAIDLHAALEKEELELKRLMHDGDVSESQLREQVDAIARIRADLEFNRLKAGLESRRTLTPEQRDQLKRRSRKR